MIDQAEPSKQVAQFEHTAQQLEDEGYQRIDVTISIVRANVEAMLWTLLPALIVYVIFFVTHPAVFDNPLGLALSLALTVVGVLICVVLHELIHGLVFAVFAPNHFKAISFGVMKEMFTPYCTCSEPLPRFAYLLGAAAPTIVLGIIPCIIGFVTGSVFWLMLGVFMFIGGGGDIAIIARLLRYTPKSKSPIYIDHPSECGFVVFEKERSPMEATHTSCSQ